jgi:hypothetical protein
MGLNYDLAPHCSLRDLNDAAPAASGAHAIVPYHLVSRQAGRNVGNGRHHPARQQQYK